MVQPRIDKLAALAEADRNGGDASSSGGGGTQQPFRVAMVGDSTMMQQHGVICAFLAERAGSLFDAAVRGIRVGCTGARWAKGGVVLMQTHAAVVGPLTPHAGTERYICAGFSSDQATLMNRRLVVILAFARAISDLCHGGGSLSPTRRTERVDSKSKGFGI